ncbi:hypothetical protein NE573_24340, partial [Parabacteroides distasonis]|nr:hypothetical protein [Parabacteroides distasonis]
DIKTLDWMEHIRRRPGMYIGKLGDGSYADDGIYLSLYNMTVEEARGNVRGREYHGLVYSVTDDKGIKVGNPFKSSLFGKSAGYEAVQKKFVRSKSE